jgi:hypothetical protein
LGQRHVDFDLNQQQVLHDHEQKLNARKGSYMVTLKHLQLSFPAAGIIMMSQRLCTS